ncbi:MAG: hypothetical protein ACREJ2_06920 [Planctomycetota bacterium]
MSWKYAFIALLCSFSLTCAAASANEQSIDGTLRVLGMPLAEAVAPGGATPDHFRAELNFGRWHVRNDHQSINFNLYGLSLAWTHAIAERWALNLHGDAGYLFGHNAVIDVRGYGLEAGFDFVYALGSHPSAAGPLNGSSLFFGLYGWTSKLTGPFQGPPRDEAVITAVTESLRAGWQGRAWVRSNLFCEPAFYLYANDGHRREQIVNLGGDDDANPTSYGAAANLQIGMDSVFEPGDRLAGGLAGAWGFDQNNSYQVQVVYTFGASPAAN